MNKEEKWVVDSDFAGLRLDAAINKKTGISRNQAQDMLKSGEILLNGSQTKPGNRLKGGEVIHITFRSVEAPNQLIPTDLNFPVIYNDQHIIVINKPSGMVVHPGAGKEKETVVSALLGFTQLSPIGAPLRPGIVHRLDKGTSGIMLLAKSKEAHQKLAADFSRHDIGKEYLAIIQGHIVNTKGRIEVAIERDKIHRKRMQVTSPEKGRMAISHFEVLEYLNGATLVKVNILTGRTHQIRVHMAFTGHPLVGDTTYGGRPLPGYPGLFLHSRHLAIKHPITAKPLIWQAKPPESFCQALLQLGMNQSAVEQL
jgi:23S rRNA pseudouridine1911/1915/1917 synthase